MNAQADAMAGSIIDAIATRVADIIFERMNLTGRWTQPTPPEDDANILKGWKEIAECLHISISKAVRMKELFGDAIMQQVENGNVTAYKDKILKKYEEICNSKN